jgi:hypothetical protein
MIDDERVKQWDQEARLALMQSYGKDDTARHLAAIVLALLADRSARERYIERSNSR